MPFALSSLALTRGTVAAESLYVEVLVRIQAGEEGFDYFTMEGRSGSSASCPPLRNDR